MKQKNLVFVCILLLGTPIIGGSCARLTQKILEPPKVQVNAVRLDHVTRDGADAVIIARVTNPNGVDLSVRRCRYVVELSGREISRGELTEPAVAKAHAESDISVRVPFLYKDVVRSLLDFLASGEIPYKVSGEAELGVFTVPFASDGKLQIPR